MDRVLFILGGQPISYGDVALALAAIAFLVLLVLTVSVVRGARQRAIQSAVLVERAHEVEEKLAEIAQFQAEMRGGVQAGLQGLDSRHADLQRLLAERIDGLQHRVGRGLAETVEKTSENLSKLNERLAVIDAAQKNLSDLTGEVVGLKDILANKQARGAYGQGRMEAIIRDGLPLGAYEFQPTLRNGKRPDCIVRVPGDHPLVIDAKFPLEGFVAFREAQSEEARKAALTRVRTDVGAHVKAIVERYLCPGETQDTALLFVPSEAVYADLQEHGSDIVERAHRARIYIVSPSLLGAAVQLMRSIARDARMREEAQTIQCEVRLLLDDVARLKTRVGKLDMHFRQAQEDVAAINTLADKVVKRGDKIDALEFDEAGPLPVVARVAAE